ncbi:MFS transporter [Gluconacetobacter liquefaciens]|uniref:MFS transporter n=1 Tax=Gluconacetobacter liquefaciens TaxID=89584 RepID=A0A370GAB5_GLULI|nr:MFS transporter [Gluconacetobacter liquefaciens]MBB2185300.1 MFS transporter [Gluconacetobacter liquefaciens]RDI40738.1 putative MFS family arabinose efflux permease [Gluconacetobacter liquefaciens]GBR03240.1 general substrate transporter [Gluconacetobacter liquefaciens NRIC 0522]GEB37737.1 MFS transporter [Gluconacetobacter liquefaciens]
MSISAARTPHPIPTTILFGCAYVLSFIDRQILSLMIGPVKADLHLNDFQFAILNGFAFALLYSVLSLPISMMADRFPRPPIIVGGLALWSVATIGCGLSNGFASLFICRMGVGIGEAALVPAVYSFLADIVPAARLGRIIALFSAGSFVGVGIAYLFGGMLMAMLQSGGVQGGGLAPWKLCFIAAGVPGLLLAVVIAIVVPEVAARGKTAVRSGLLQTGAFILDRKWLFLLHFLGYSCSAIMLFSLMSWSPAYLMRVMAMPHAAVGAIMSGIAILCGCGGVYTSGRLMDALTTKGVVIAPMIVGGMGMVSAALLFLVSVLCGAGHAGLVFFALAFFFASFPMAPSAVLIQTVTPHAMRAQVSAIMLLCNALIGLSGGSMLIGVLSDRVFTAPDGIRLSLAVVAIPASLAGALMVAATARLYAKRGRSPAQT